MVHLLGHLHPLACARRSRQPGRVAALTVIAELFFQLPEPGKTFCHRRFCLRALCGELRHCVHDQLAFLHLPALPQAAAGNCQPQHKQDKAFGDCQGPALLF